MNAVTVRHTTQGVVFGDPERHAVPAKRDWPVSREQRATIAETTAALRAWLKLDG